MSNLKKSFRIGFASLRVAVCLALLINFAQVAGAQTKSRIAERQNAVTARSATVTLTDSFADQNQDGKAQAGEEVTYTATIINQNSVLPMNSVTLSASVDPAATVVENSVQVKPDSLSPYALRCTFFTLNGGFADCEYMTAAYGATTTENNSIIGGQNNRLRLTAANAVYNPQDGVFTFDVTLENLIMQSLGTIDGATLDPAGVQLFINNIIVNSGEGSISAVNADGTYWFTLPDQTYFQFNQIIRPNEISAPKTVQLNVPNTVNSFTVDFLVSTKAMSKLVINEVMANPFGSTLDAGNGEWFEFYNAGLFPVNLQNFLINDFSAGSVDCTTFPCPRPSHQITSSVTIQPGGYLVMGNKTDTTVNGGVTVDYAYGASLALANSRDGVRIQSPDGVTLDEAIYWTPTISALDGISRELKDPSFDNSNIDDQNIWQDASTTTVYGSGGRGTPGAANSKTEISGAPHSASTLCLARQATTGGAGNDVFANIGTIAPGQTVVVTYTVKLADPLPQGLTEISSQAVVSDDACLTILSDDPVTEIGGDSTITPLEAAAAQPGYFISGTVTYGTTPANEPMKYVPDVSMNISGSSSFLTASVPAATNQTGDYQISNLTPGASYTVTPSKTGGNEGITSFDATLVLRCVAAGQNCELTKDQEMAADTDLDGSVSSFDATQILRFVAAGAQSADTGQTGNWLFNPASVKYSEMSDNATGQNYKACLIGEVDGNWTPMSSLADNSAKKETPLAELKSLSAQIGLSLPSNAEAFAGEIVSIPVYLTNTANKPISAYSFAVRFDPSVLQPESDAAEAPAGLTLVSDTNTPGRIGIAASAPNGFLTSGTLLNLRFKVIAGSKSSTAATALIFETTKRGGMRFEDQNGNKIVSAASNGFLKIANLTPKTK